MLSAHSNHSELRSGVQRGCPMMLQKTGSGKASQFPGTFHGHHCRYQTKASLIACLVGLAAMYGFPAGAYTLNSLHGQQWL